MNKFLKYGVTCLCAFAGSSASSFLDMHLYDAYLKQNNARAIAAVQSQFSDKSQITADQTHGAGIFNLLVTANNTMHAVYEQLSDEGKRLIDVALTDLWTTKNGTGDVWSGLLATLGAATEITNTDQILTWLNGLGREAAMYERFCKGKTRPSHDVSAYGRTAIKAWQLIGEQPASVGNLLDRIIEKGASNASAPCDKETKELATRLRNFGLDLGSIIYQGTALFANTTQGNESLNHEALNALNTGTKEESQDRWAKLYLWNASQHLTDGQATNSEQLYYLTRFGKGQGMDQSHSKPSHDVEQKLKELEEKANKMEEWIGSQGYFYDNYTGKIEESAW